MVKEQLTDSMVQAGAELVASLDDSDTPATAAFWLLEPEIAEWRLIIVTPKVSAQGPRKVYEEIQTALRELGDRASAAPFSVIALRAPESDLIRHLKVAINTGPGIHRIRFSKDVVDGRFIDDALIYRVT
jgi:hypothetical protein